MTIESATTIFELNEAWPLFNDNFSEGDDVMRLIKEVLKLQFQSSDGLGLREYVTTSAAQLNFSNDVTAPIQEQLEDIKTDITALQDNLSAPAGTLLMFGEAFVPTGWTVQNYGDRYSLVIIDPSMGNTPGWRGGSDNPVVYTATHSHNITIDPNNMARSGTDIFIAAEGFTQPGGVDWEPTYLEAVIAAKD